METKTTIRRGSEKTMRWNRIACRMVIFIAICGVALSTTLLKAGVPEEPWALN